MCFCFLESKHAVSGLVMSRILNSIVAVCPDMGIGNKGQLPWHSIRLNNELKFFQRMTATPSIEGRQNVVIMGRNTWFSIPAQNRPLKNRINIVLSRQLNSALHLLDTAELAGQVDQVWVIGGSTVYKEVMEAQGQRRLFVTRVLQQFDCDTFLPSINPAIFRLLPGFPGVPEGIQEENGIQYKYEVYESVPT
ncbi:dihydrofolate reductase isoform X2 [Anguilla rostrata]|uniref:dihydrofolate reductase isoform X2 n=1 Tax=Anguilla rostrata TaxID=7938 RepID=UPI0030CB7B31